MAGELFRRRQRAFEKSNKCFVCKEEIANIEDCTLEHIIPKSRGGTNISSNLAVSHKDCNAKKSNHLILNGSAEEYLQVLRTLKAINEDLREEVRVLKEVVATKKKHLRESSMDREFLKRRIIELHGHNGLIRILSHVDCPRGFDIEGYCKAHGLDSSGNKTSPFDPTTEENH